MSFVLSNHALFFYCFHEIKPVRTESYRGPGLLGLGLSRPRAYLTIQLTHLAILAVTVFDTKSYLRLYHSVSPLKEQTTGLQTGNSKNYKTRARRSESLDSSGAMLGWKSKGGTATARSRHLQLTTAFHGVAYIAVSPHRAPAQLAIQFPARLGRDQTFVINFFDVNAI